MFDNDIDINKILKQLSEGNSLLKRILTDDVLAQLTDEQLEEIQKGISITDPKKIKLEAEKILKNYKS